MFFLKKKIKVLNLMFVDFDDFFIFSCFFSWSWTQKRSRQHENMKDSRFKVEERISERTVEQIVDIPLGGLPGFSPGHGSTAVCGAEHTHFPVPLGRGGFGDGGLHGLSQGQGSTAFCEAEHVDIPVPLGRGGLGDGGLHGLSQGQGSTAVCEAEHVDISVPHGRGKLGDGVFSASSAGAADEGPAVRGSGMGKARFTGEDAPRGPSSRGKAGSTGDDAPRVFFFSLQGWFFS